VKRSITDVRGIRVGHAGDLSGITGVTVVLCEKGATAGGVVLGGAPGTRETDLLSPINTVDKVHAVFLSGGSAFGLDAASGIVRYLEGKGIGFDTGVARVPIVTGAILFDLGIGDPKARPTPEMAYAASRDASSGPSPSGNVGAGLGATVGKLYGPGFAMKSGLGTWSLETRRGFTVGSVVAVNALGDIYDPETGRLVAGAFDREKRMFLSRDSRKTERGDLWTKGGSPPFPGTNTTIGVVAVDAYLSKAECHRIALMAAGGLARCIRPSFTPFDGDAVFVLATGEKDRSCRDASVSEEDGHQGPRLEGSADPEKDSRALLTLEVGRAAQECLALSVLDAVLSSESLGGYPGLKDIMKDTAV